MKCDLRSSRAKVRVCAELCVICAQVSLDLVTPTVPDGAQQCLTVSDSARQCLAYLDSMSADIHPDIGPRQARHRPDIA